MEKLSLEEFRIRIQKIRDVIEKAENEDLSDDDIKVIINEYVETINSLKGYDLSEIPSEEWEGFMLFDLGEYVEEKNIYDFSGSGANLDFSIIPSEFSRMRHNSEEEIDLPKLKGCNITNFDFSAPYTPEMFDDDFIKEHQEYFLFDETIPEEVKDRFYTGEVSIEDIKKYPEIFEKIQEYNISYNLKNFYSRFGKEEFVKLDFDFLSETSLWSTTYMNEHPEITTVDELMENLYSEARKEILSDSERPDDYRSYRLPANIREYGEKFKSRNPDLYLPEEAPEELKEKYYGRTMSFLDYSRNIEYLENKNVDYAMRYSYSASDDKRLVKYFGDDLYTLVSRYKNQIILGIENSYRPTVPNLEGYEGTLDEKIDVLKSYIKGAIDLRNIRTINDLNMYSGILTIEDIVKEEMAKTIVEGIGIEKLIELGYGDTRIEDLNKGFSKVEDIEKVQEYFEDVTKVIKRGLSIPKGLTIEKLKEYQIEDISFFNENYTKDLHKLKELMGRMPLTVIPLGSSDKEKRAFINKYGIDNMIKLDEETQGIFSHVTHVGNYDSYLTVLALQEKNSGLLETSTPETYEEFKEAMYKDLVLLRTEKGLIRTANYPNYDFIQGEFREQHQDIFIDEEGYSYAFYKSNMHQGEVRNSEKLQEILLDKNIGLVFSERIESAGLVGESGVILGKNVYNFASYISKNYGNKAYLDLCKKYGSLLHKEDIWIKDLEISLEELDKEIGKFLYKRIVEKGKIYDENVSDEFKTKYSDIFLPDTVSQEIKDKFYKGNLNLEDIRNNPGLKDILVDKNIKVGLHYYLNTRINLNNNYTISNLMDKMDTKTFLEFAEKYGEYLLAVNPSKITEGIKIEELDELIKKEIELGILDRTTRYGENAPEFFKAKYPEYFLSEDAPEIVKLKYYTSYIAEDGEYAGHSSSNYSITINDLKKDQEFRKFIEGKKINLTNSKSIRNLLDSHTISIQGNDYSFSEQDILDMVDVDSEAVEVISKALSSNIEKFSIFYKEKPKFFAKKELMEIEGYTEEEIERIISADPETEKDSRILDGIKLYESKTEKFRRAIVSSPGYVFYYSDDISSGPYMLYDYKDADYEFNFAEYKELFEMSKFNISDNFRRGVAENIIANMYRMLGYAGAKEVLKLPDIDEEELTRIIRENGNRFKEIYEEKYKLEGNLKVTNTLFSKLVPLLPGKKQTFNVYKSLNQKLEEGYRGSLEDLLKECLEENGCKYDETKINSCVKNTKEIHTSEKINLALETIISRIDNDFVETTANKKILKDILLNSYKKSLNASETLDREFIKRFLEKEFARTKQDGTSFYSPHITSHLDDLLKITDDLNNDQVLGIKLNKSVVDLLKEEKEKIGKGWIRKLSGISSELSKEEYESLSTRLYGEGSEIEIPATRTVDLKDKSEQGIRDAYVLLKELELPGVFTYEKGEQMFVGLGKPFSEEFAKFFLKNRIEMLRKPEYYTKFQKMHSEFDEIIQDSHINNRYKSGKYTLGELLDEINNTVYEGVNPGEYDLEYNSRKAGLEKEYFSRAQEVYAMMKEREVQTIPTVEYNGKNYRGRILRIDDPLHLVIGNITTCCQKFGKGQPGEPSMLHSALERNGSVFIVEEVDEYGRAVGSPVAQSWTWRNGDRVCFDNVEIPDTIHEELSQKNAYIEIFKIYQETAKKMIDIDRKILQRMLDDGKITPEQYDAIVIKEVTVGNGCDDLLRNVPYDKKAQSSTVRPLEDRKEYQVVSGEMKTPWIDSEIQYVLAKNNADLERINPKEKHPSTKGEVPIGYTKIRETIRRTGKDINRDILAKISGMNEKNSTKENSKLSRIESIPYYFDDYDEFLENEKNISIAISENEDWYIFTRENSKSVVIEESLLLTGSGSSLDDDLAKLEYETEILTIMQIAHDKGKYLKVRQDSEGKYPLFEKLAQEGLIDISRGKITIKDYDKIDQTRRGFTKEIQKKKDERIVENAKLENEDEER